MAIVMVAMLAFGGTYAYFTGAASRAATEAKTGHINLSADGGIFTQELSQKILPGEYLLGSASEATFNIVDASNRASYVFVKVEVKAYQETDTTKANPTTLSIDLLAQGKEVTVKNGQTAVDFAKLTGTYADSGVYAFLTVTKDADAEYTGTTFTVAGEALKIQIPTTWEDEWEDATIEVSIVVESIQAVNFDDATAAYTALRAQKPLA